MSMSSLFRRLVGEKWAKQDEEEEGKVGGEGLNL